MSMDSVFDAVVGEVLPGARVTELVGKSRRALVYRCRCATEPFQGEYCVKVLNAEGAYLRHQLHVLERIAGLQSASAECANQLPLARIVRFEVPRGPQYPNPPQLCLVTRWIEGETLAQVAASWARTPQGVPLREALATLAAVAEALASLASVSGCQPLIHQDIKPSNIVLSSNGASPCVQFVDLDTAFFLGDPTDAIPFGSYGYAAPECLERREGWASPAADVFSFGATAHEVLTGSLPHPFVPNPRNGRQFWLSYYRRTDALSPSEYLPADVRELLAACLSLDPQKRPSAPELAKRTRQLAERHNATDYIRPAKPQSAPFPTPLDSPCAPAPA